MIVGHYAKAGGNAIEAANDTAVALKATMPDSGAFVTQLTALLDGGGPGSGVQSVRGGLWTPAGTLLGLTDPVTIAPADTLAWVNLVYDVPLAGWDLAEEMLLGLVFGESSETARYYANGTAGYTASPDYETGTNITPVAGWATPLLFATYIIDIPLPEEEDTWYARLGFLSAQAKFAETGPERNTRTTVQAGWHGTWLDAEPQGGSFAIVDRAGPLADWVGERVKVTSGKHSAYVFVHRSTDLDDGEVAISLSRRAFAELALLSTESLDVKVEQMS